MLRSLIITIMFLTSSQTVFAASSGGGSSSSSSGGSSSASSSSGSYSSSNNEDSEVYYPFSNAKRLIYNGEFDEAHKALKSLPDMGDRAERYNLLGFTARKSGNLVTAAEYYKKALSINSKHVGALQYQGELFITLGEIEKAKQNLVKIEKICWLFSCSEGRKLDSAIQKAANS